MKQISGQKIMEFFFDGVELMGGNQLTWPVFRIFGVALMFGILACCTGRIYSESAAEIMFIPGMLAGWGFQAYYGYRRHGGWVPKKKAKE